MHEIYVIVVYETTVAIFNSQTGDFLEEQGVLDRFKYRAACLNHQTGDIYLLAHNTSKAANIVQTMICQLKEIPAQDQIDFLLSSCRIDEARDIFNLKENKGDGTFTSKTNQFDLDVGWIKFTKMLDLKGMLNDFKRTDIDPRELIVMYKHLLIYNPESLKKHFTRSDFTFDITTVIENYKLAADKMNLNTQNKVAESKKYVIAILEHKNQMFVSELNKNQNKSVKFLYSKFSPFSNWIKKDKQVETGVILKEVVSFIQTNLIKLYVEMKD